ncbi:hypothetical protein [Nakamurella flava]|nr:hypothetical protein [Nakamurella flava]
MIHLSDLATFGAAFVFAVWAYAVHLCRDIGPDGADETAWD